jgi:hypothetical protein
VLFAAALAVILAAAPSVFSYPEPSLVSSSWQLDFSHGTPRKIAVQLPGETVPRLYWYMTYKVTNNTGEDRLFVPKFTIYNNRGEIIQAGRGISPTVFDKIHREQRNPLLESPIEVVGRLLQGEDNARESVAIWPASEDDIDEMRIFIGGLSGETARVEDPVTGETVILRKTRVLDYATPGADVYRVDKSIALQHESWVMR